ncbi:LysR family transcriptional regulator [Ramlibacter sp.]|uniref:LysR family transcriptional regulator n=1 Tax=Ramlibacter sp. TaxID=1917967 RepID=UPI00260B9810|nr:LysR family transcriptional regulator [Ramlibacter sp.]MDB5956478.1 ywbI [Ramlibacter sp.]
MGIDIDLRRLRFFVEVVRQGGFSSAAKVMFATQSTVSKAVKQLESELGVELLRRLGNRSELTDAGRVVYERGLGLLEASAGMGNELAELAGLSKGRLEIGFPRVGTSSLFGGHLASFSQKFPSVEMTVTVEDVSTLVGRLFAGVLEIAALFEPVAAGLEFQPAVQDELLVLLPASHPLAAGAAVDIRALRDLPLILFEQGVPANELILQAFARAGITPRIASRTSQLELLFELSSRGMGVAFVPRQLVSSRPPLLTRALPLQDCELPWNVGFAWRRGGYLSHAARAWLEHTAPRPSA